MTLSVVRSVAVLDRTGSVQAAMEPLDVDVREVVHPGDLETDRREADVLLVGARELTSAGLRRLARWRRLHPASVVLAHLDGTQVDRGVLRAAGVEHAFRGRVTPARLRAALERADDVLLDLLAATGRLHPDQDNDEAAYDSSVEDDAGDEVSEELGDEAETTPARLVTIASATGGCGKTFFATTVATMLARRGLRVLLVDLDLQFGEVATALQVQHPYSLYDGLYATTGERLPATALREHLDDLVCHHSLGFDVLTAPRDPVLADYVTTRDARVILDSVSPRYDVVVTDTPPALNDVVITALDRSDLVYVLATLDVPSLRNMTAFLDVLGRLNLRDDRLRLVLNKAQSDVGVTVEQANDAFNGRFRSVLPADRAVSRAVNLGTTVTISEPRAKVSRAILPVIDDLAAGLGFAATSEAAAVTYDAAPRHLFGRLWRRLVPGGTS